MSTDIAQGIGHSARAAVYTIPDAELAMGSTLGAPKVCTILKGSGAIEQVYSPDRGLAVFGALTLRHWDEQTGMHLAPQMGGSFILHPSTRSAPTR